MIFSDGVRKVEIENQIIQNICRYLQLNRKSHEAGGMLLGREIISTNNLIVDKMTEPFPLDKRSRFRFFRKDSKHVDYYYELYNASKQIYKYVGEWHTHPEAVPSYSFIDKKEWKRIVKSCPEDMAIYCIIAGTEKWRIWMVTSDSKPQLLYEQDYDLLQIMKGHIMRRMVSWIEKKVCKQVDDEWRDCREPYEDSLVSVCNEIERKVKGALWKI